MGYDFTVPEVLCPKAKAEDRTLNVVLVGAAVFALSFWCAVVVWLWRVFIRWVS